jgi:hypothetical protein
VGKQAYANDVARVALDWAAVEPPIRYTPNGSTRKGTDCQGFIEGCIREAGGAADYAGSNAMFRACLKAGCWWTLDEAKRLGKLIPGASLFAWNNKGGEVARGYRDGLGDADHTGLYVGQSSAVWSVDASASATRADVPYKGFVRTRTERDAPYVWTHVGWLSEISFEYAPTNELPQVLTDSEPPPESSNMSVAGVSAAYPAQFAVIATSVNLRRTPSTNAAIRGRASNGETLLISSSKMHGGRAWGETKTKGSDGRMIDCWVAMDDGAGNPYLQRVNVPEPQPAQVTEPQPAPVPQPAKADPLDTLGKLVDLAVKLQGL